MFSRFWTSQAWSACVLISFLVSPALAFAQAPIEIPGRVEAEFPTTFYDTTGGNASGQSQCSTTDLDAQTTGDVGGGCNVGWTAAGEWTEYEVRSDEMVSTEMVVRAATAQNGRSMHVEIDGENVTGAIQVANHGWQSYRDYVVPVTLSAGFHTVRAVFDTGSVNLNYIDFLVPEPVVPYAVPARIEAEDFHDFYDLSSGNNGAAGCGTGDVDIEYTGDVDGVCNVGWTQSGEWLSYNLKATIAGDYEVRLRVASAYQGRRIQIDLNDGQQGQMVVPGSGWQSFSDVTLPLTLPQGDSVLTVSFPDGSVNLNYFEVEGPAIVDSDADGVEDANDQCPDTSAGSPVNSVGCPDDDGDGVFNNEDQCSNTPVSESPDSTGCSPSQLDDDGDGVSNDTDQCANTPVGAPINSEGCTDTDTDGVADAADLCPVTAPGATVNAQGCADDDGDSVFNNEDLCADTPSEEQADNSGCSDSQKDHDGDGVANSADHCANTPVGESVDSSGCSDSQKDDDGDGIFNDLDQCLSTPVGNNVNAAGCSDGDDDGVADTADVCPASALGATVNSQGCADDDGDSVYNNKDQCANTPVGESADNNGCSDSQKDDDGDGIFNDLDQCLNTPAGNHVNAAGCSDGDEDGVADAEDQCQNTPIGLFVNAVGCSDDDGDGVFNNEDQCGNTPLGEPTNSMGCAPSQLDEDGDAVPDSLDLCPGTVPGAVVDPMGCSDTQADDDFDGVANSEDLCPTTSPSDAGSVMANGCAPWGDEDEDRVPNDLDHCVLTAGLWEVGGCKPLYADFDSDGVQDDVDQCPYTKARSDIDPFGCSPEDFNDEDMDGVLNGHDLCPWARDAGGQTEGCDEFSYQDDDGDGVMNGVDFCPNEFGPKALNGCWATLWGVPGAFFDDVDTDGVLNLFDHCPFTPDVGLNAGIGPNGCAQTIGYEDLDQDGVVQAEDVCPGTALGHVADAKGCSYSQQAQARDTDEDGVNDALDQCADFAGTGLLGCDEQASFFDMDRDGLPDAFDQCVSEPGHRLLGGCPEPSLGPWPHFADRDGDGQPFGEDLCPYSVASLENGSAPYPWTTMGCNGQDLADYDGDGVINGKDLCLNSRNRLWVDAEGCDDYDRVDNDQDGVMNGVDLCPNVLGLPAFNGCAPNGLPGDSDADGVLNQWDYCLYSVATPGMINPDTGCETVDLFNDDDGDGVTNDFDQCSETSKALPVDRNTGCHVPEQFITLDIDQDNDGVWDIHDLCEGTPEGEPVDATGCMSDDADGDGVSNWQDECPDTMRGLPMDWNGCVFGAAAELQAPIVFRRDENLPPDIMSFVIDESDVISTTGQPLPGPLRFHVGLPALPELMLVEWEWGVLRIDAMNTPSGPVLLRPLAIQVVDGMGVASPWVMATFPGSLEPPLDSDGDLIPDDLDLCPNTAHSEANYVMENGCVPWGDEDGDSLFNDMDHCPSSAGLIEVGGCKPLYGDFDGDGVLDDVDQCLYTKARSSTDPNGCSPEDFADGDMDGTPNGQDLCPGLYGYEEGCDEFARQDNDGDGVMNGLDFCPEEFGVKSLNGCGLLGQEPGVPNDDVDNDGVSNKFDHCPFTPEQALPTGIGPNGCAQTIGLEDLDQDGVALANDVCPGTALGHVADAKGCSYSQQAQARDTDEDGVNDALDQCPDFAGEGLLGCDEQAMFMDMDRDGLPDEVDQCISEPGHRLFGGCAEPSFGPWPNLDDRDGDGEPFGMDQCPYSLAPLEVGSEPHSWTTKGCNGQDLADYDGDGVINGKDLCPNSRNRLWVDTEGCDDYDRVDNDQDGVINGVDLCPSMMGLPAFNGCAPFGSMDDGDGDGVQNLWDQCPYRSPMSGMVDPETGCESPSFMKDDDGDGVTNDFDQCLDTPKAYPVSNVTGCHLPEQFLGMDQDNDGVRDDLDLCPGTPEGEPVDAAGCFTDDIDGDGVDNEQDECPNTPRALPMDWNGCVLSASPQVQTPIVLKRDENVPTGITSFFIHEEDLTAPMEMPFAGPVSFNVMLPDVPEIILVASQWGELRIDVAGPSANPPLLRPVAVQVVDGMGEASPWFTVSFPGGMADLGALIVNDSLVLNDSGMSLTQVFDLLSRHNDSVNGLQLFRQFWDSQRTMPFGPSPYNCNGMVNGFEIACDRTETEVAFFSEMDTQMEMDSYRLTAAVNRVDLNDDWQNCGEQRLVFARDPNTPFPLWGGSSGRQFINVEARLPNPIPGDVEGCRAIIEFWHDLSTAPMFDKGFQLNELFYAGLPPFYPPLMSPEFFEATTGQIRTTQFLGGEWLFKEHKLQHLCDGFGCNYWVNTGTVQETPIGALFGPVPSVSSPEEQVRADLIVQFQNWFPMNLEPLMSQQLADLKNPVPDEFNNGQSHGAGVESLENDYSAHYSGQWGSAFDMSMQNAVMGRQNADGSPLMVEQVLARATTQTCGGCHAPESFGLEMPGRIGTLAMPDGSQIDAWPRSHDFVHINEMGELSPALEAVFLPMRAALFNEALEALNQSF